MQANPVKSHLSLSVVLDENLISTKIIRNYWILLFIKNLYLIRNFDLISMSFPSASKKTHVLRYVCLEKRRYIGEAFIQSSLVR